MKNLVFALLAAFILAAPIAEAGKYPKCDKEEKKCLKNPMRKMTGECKKNRKRCEKDESRKQAKIKAQKNKPLPVAKVRGDMLLNSALEKLVNNQRPKSWKVSSRDQRKANVKVHGGRKNARTGSKAIQLKNGKGSFSQVVPLAGEGESRGLYKLTYYIKGDGSAKKAKLSVMNEAISRGDLAVTNVANHNRPSNKWQKHEKFITIKDDAFAMELKFNWDIVAKNGGKNGSIWIDDISLVKQ